MLDKDRKKPNTNPMLTTFIIAANSTVEQIA